jgi:hypothetical protein
MYIDPNAGGILFQFIAIGLVILLGWYFISSMGKNNKTTHSNADANLKSTQDEKMKKCPHCS